MANPPNSQPVPGTKVANSATPRSYQPTQSEVSLIDKLGQQMRAEIPLPRLKKSEDGRSVVLDHPNQGIAWAILMNALGTTDINFAQGILLQLAKITAIDGDIDEPNLNFALAMLVGLKPTNQEETSEGVLRVASYLCAVKMAGHVYRAETIGELQHADNALNKCARTYVTLSETLTRKRSRGQQNVTVQNVAVNDNAQAVVTGPHSRPHKSA
jgi:hypothetical protein